MNSAVILIKPRKASRIQLNYPKAWLTANDVWMWMHVCIPTSIFKHTAVGTPAQTCHAIQEGEIQELETEKVMAFLQWSNLPCSFSMQGIRKARWSMEKISGTMWQWGCWLMQPHFCFGSVGFGECCQPNVTCRSACLTPCRAELQQEIGNAEQSWAPEAFYPAV